MNNKRIKSGRLAKVEERRRTKRTRIFVGLAVTLGVTALVFLAVHYRNALFESGDTKVKKTEKTTTEEKPVETTPEEKTIPYGVSGLKVYVVNNTKVPQRFGNALTAIEKYNVENENLFTVETERPKISYGGGTMILYRPGYKEYADAIAGVLGGSFSTVQADITMICGQDISELILEAFVKEGRLTEEVRVEVLNGCGLEGAAGKAQERLESNGYTVVAVGNAANFDYKHTILLTPESNEERAERIKELFGMEDDKIERTDYDVKVIIGDDYTP
jgi:hypothetical protein